MAKKKRTAKRTAKRSTKALKRPPSTKRSAAKGKVRAFQSGAFQGLPPSASQRKLSTAVQSTIGGAEPPLPLRASAQTIEPPSADLRVGTTAPEVRIQGVGTLVAGSSAVDGTGFVLPAPVAITPTAYPDSPQGAIIVQNHVTINIRSNEFGQFNKNMEALIAELRRSNEISGEVRDQLLSELRAGREIISGPKPERGLVDVLLLKPLKWLAEKSGSAIIGKLAGDALAWLLRMIGAA